MAFFDDLSKKLTQAGQTAMQKTREVTDIARLNGMIADEERVMNNCYNQIGKIYVSLHSSDYEEAFAEHCKRVDDAERKIQEYRQQIETTKNAGRCAKCGSEITNGAAFCSVCGASVQKGEQRTEEKSAIRYCAACGAVSNEDMRFCALCGKPTTSEATPDQNDVVVEPSIEKEPVKRKCPSCGIEVDEKLLYCLECGTKLK